MGQQKKRKTTTSAKSVNYTANQSLILLVLAVFLLFVVFIQGNNIWTKMHQFIFGIFGFMSYFFVFMFLVISVLCVAKKNSKAFQLKEIELSVLGLLIAGFTDVIMTNTTVEESFGKHLANAYSVTISKYDGGLLGALIGNPIFRAFGKTGAIITFVLLIFVLLIFLTGFDLALFFGKMEKPMEGFSERVKARMDANRDDESKTDQKAFGKKKVNIDIPIDERKIKPNTKETESLSDKQKKVLHTYHGTDDAEQEELPNEPEGASDKKKIDYAIDTAKKEAVTMTQAELEREEMKISEQISGGMVMSEDEGYRFPPISLLHAPKYEDGRQAAAELDKTAEHLVETLRSFGVETKIVDICRGPTVTRYELQPCAGVKISKITNLADDIALNLATAGVRIEAPIPNKAAVGIEVPNKLTVTVGVREIIESPSFVSAKSKLSVAMGKDIAGNVVIADIGKMPHGLIAGATGSGKSVCINSIIVSLLYKAKPDEVKLLMIDPKVVELGVYNGIPHLLVPVVTDPRKAAGALGWAVSEMEKRYQMFSDRGVRDIAGYNKLVETLTDEPEVQKMPHIVITIDELVDLMMTAPGEVEDSINRIAAKARAAGMHLLIATQRPSVDVVTGVIKANIPTRIAFAVSSQIDSRTILDTGGAEKLLGRGDMLFNPVGATKPNRVQGCFVSDEEVEAVVDFIKHGGSADYDDNIMVEIERQAAMEKQKKTGLPEDAPDDDPMLEEAIRVVVENGQASTSLLQRRLKLGYARAARIIDEMEQRGIVGPYEGSKPRKVLISMDQLMEKEASED